MTPWIARSVRAPVGELRQRGAVLVVGLIFLVLMTLIGVTAYSVATQEERMAGNARDRLRAFEAAEVALRECERRLSAPLPPDFFAGGFDPDDAQNASKRGFYSEPAAGAPDTWESIDWSGDPTRQLSGIDGVAEQPRCIVQRIGRAVTSNASLRAELPQAGVFAYQVTARGVGASRNTAVLLQTTFMRD